MLAFFSLSTLLFSSPFICSHSGGSTWCSGDGKRVCSQPIITLGPLEGFKGSGDYLENEKKNCWKIFVHVSWFVFSFFLMKQFCSSRFKKWVKWNNLRTPIKLRNRKQTQLLLTWILFIFCFVSFWRIITPASQYSDAICLIFSFNRHLLVSFQCLSDFLNFNLKSESLVQNDTSAFSDYDDAYLKNFSNRRWIHNSRFIILYFLSMHTKVKDKTLQDNKFTLSDHTHNRELSLHT